MYQPKVILVVLDGWGYSQIREGNAIMQAATPNFDKLWQYYPHALIEAAGAPVGLPWGSIGSSEVGHACLGAGRIINQDLPRINQAIASGELYRNPVLLEALNHTKRYKSNLHLIGLVSAAGVHSHINHLFALLKLLKNHHFRQPSFIHMFTDGRDSPVKSAPLYIDKLNFEIQRLHLATQIASVTGRFYAMDRDSRWERTFAAYNCLVLSKGEIASSAKEAVLKSYEKGQTDEFIKPTVIMRNQQPAGILERMFQKGQTNESFQPVGLIKSNDAVIFFNFRPERIRQLVETFLFPQQNYPGKIMLKNLYLASIVEYERSLPVQVALPPEKILNPLAKIISDRGLKQLHIAETEKYAQSTYFFDGGNPTPYKNEDWVVVPSPRVKTYDLRPEMSAQKITDKIFEICQKKNYDFIFINYANPDMVGHTGNLKAGIKAIEAVDKELGRLTSKFPNTIFLITADHGNAEKMVNPEGGLDTEHSVAPVPFILVAPQYQKSSPDSDQTKSVGLLADIAPTVLDALNIEIPPEMTGFSLLRTIT